MYIFSGTASYNFSNRGLIGGCFRACLSIIRELPATDTIAPPMEPKFSSKMHEVRSNAEVCTIIAPPGRPSSAPFDMKAQDSYGRIFTGLKNYVHALYLSLSVMCDKGKCRGGYRPVEGRLGRSNLTPVLPCAAVRHLPGASL